jgi:hypothetical protein
MRKHGAIYKYHVYHTLGKIPLLNQSWKGWVYEIYTQFDDVLVRESKEWFDSEAQAGFAAVGHISLLENGEG